MNLFTLKLQKLDFSRPFGRCGAIHDYAVPLEINRSYIRAYMSLALLGNVRLLRPIQRGFSASSIRRLTSADQAMEKVEETPPTTASATPQPPPKLSPAEFRIYNSMADHMDLFVP